MTTATRQSDQLSNNTLQPFKSNLVKISDNLFTFNLQLKNKKIMTIPMREDGYINATLLCKAGSKIFSEYKRSKQTKDYIEALKSNMENSHIELFEAKRGGNHSGTYVHRKVGIHLAQWISPEFSIQVTNCIEELLLFGKVELGNEKSNKELENKFQQQIQILTEEKNLLSDNYKKLALKHQSILKRRARDSYNTGSVIYILSHEAFTGQYNCDYFTIPYLKICYYVNNISKQNDNSHISK